MNILIKCTTTLFFDFMERAAGAFISPDEKPIERDAATLLASLTKGEPQHYYGAARGAIEGRGPALETTDGVAKATGGF